MSEEPHAGAAGRFRPTTVVVVTHDGAGPRIRACLDSLVRAGGHDAVVVVDNSEGPIDGSDTRHLYGPGVTAVVTMPNRGYGAAANAGFARAVQRRADTAPQAIALLNDDITVREGWLTPLLAALAGDEAIGAVQPKLLLDEGGVVNSVGVQFDRFHAGSDIGYGEPDGPRWTGGTEIEAFSGGAVLFRQEFLADLGGFDERYFLYYEDVDLSLRGRERGWRYRCERDSIVDHAFGASTSALGAGRLQLQERNHLWSAARFAPPAATADALWLAARRVARPPRRVHAAALAAGIAGMAPRLVERCRVGRGRR